MAKKKRKSAARPAPEEEPEHEPKAEVASPKAGAVSGPEETRVNRALAAGMFAGPAAWALHQQVSYMMTPSLCRSGNEAVLHLVTLLALALVAAGAWTAWRTWKLLPEGSTERGDDQGSRARFLALGGAVLSAFFFLVILAQEVPNWFLGACVR